MKPACPKTPPRELQLQQARAFQSLNLLASGVAHDFNNVIAGILGSAEILKLDLPPDQPDNPVLEQIFTASRRARHLIEQLKNFCGRQPGERTLIPLPLVVEAAARELRDSVPATVEIVHDVDANCPAILADAAQIQQIILSLGTNAAHSFGGRRGRIEVWLETCAVSAELAAQLGLSAGAHARLSVRDNGGHFSQRTLERIFEPFAWKQINGHDSGLELFAAREIVHAHDGVIAVESAPGEGTVFKIYFPVPDNAPGENPVAG